MRRMPTREEMFNRDDVNGDGGIDQEELSAVTDKLSEMSGQTIDAEELMAEFDANEDGLLDQSEMESAMAKLREEMGPPPQKNLEQQLSMSSTGQMPSFMDILNQNEEEESSSLLSLTV
jgi:Ca2+-binding EF-hand superfamily protein